MNNEPKAKIDLYEEEKTKLIENEKNIFVKKLNDISKEISTYKTVEDFLVNNLNKDEPIVPEINNEKSETLIWFNMKIIGIFFMTTYITGVYIFIGFMDSIFEEIKASATLYLFNTTRNEEETFYYNYNIINQEPPEFELYFLTSNFSDKIFGVIDIYAQTIIILIINALIFLGIYNFDFHILPENININYSVWQFLYLLLMYILLYLSIGFISSLPHSIFTSAFDQYEKWEKERKKNNNNQEINEEKKEEYNGYFVGYFISILFSMAFKFILNKFLIVQKNIKIRKFYAVLISCHCIPIIISLLFYCFFSIIFKKKVIETLNKKKTISNCRICGYVYYSENVKTDTNKIKCEGCRKGFRRCYYNCFCYKCKCLDCCECTKCCCCIGEEQNLSEVNNRENQIYISYKTTGKCSWLCDLITNRFLLLLVLILFFLELINFGFKPSLSNFLENYDNSKLYIINILSLAGILLFFFITYLAGFLFKKCFDLKEEIGEGTYLGLGIIPLIFTGSLVSFIVSILSYFDIVSEKVKHYIIPLSIGSVEFYKILLQKVSDAIFKTQALLSFDSLFSFYIIIWNIFAFILELTKVKVSKLILIQFIITLIIIALVLIAIIYVLKKRNEILLYMLKDKMKKEKQKEEADKKNVSHNNVIIYNQEQMNTDENIKT